jgi:SAM-dependent methyltransferase
MLSESDPHSWVEVPLDDLPRWSDWPARVLGLTEWTVRERTRAKVEAEYDADKYASCLAYLKDHPDSTPEDVRAFEFGEDDETICISRSGSLFSCSLARARELYIDLLVETMATAITAGGSVVELGCGYGYNLGRLAERFPGSEYRGGDYSANAVEIAQILYGNGEDVVVQRFDFYETPYALLDGLPEPLTVFTSHSLEQVPAAGPVLDALVSAGSRIASVFHFEPLHSPGDDSLLGLMRLRYDELNDYNRDLAQELRERPDVRVHRLQADALGLNPLHPVGIAHWEPIT